MANDQIQSGTAGRFGILRQSAFNVPQGADSGFFYTAFTDCSFGPVEAQGSLPPEAGNTKALPRGVFKAGVHAEGGLDFIPRLDNRFGYWLDAVCGDASVNAATTIANDILGVVGGDDAQVNTHLFGFVDGNDFDLPYLTGHRWLPHDTAASSVGEIIQDIRVAQFVLNVPAAAPVTASMQMLGRCSGATIWDINPAWSQPTLDDDDTFMVTSCAGSVKLSVAGGSPATTTAFDVANVRLTWTNVLLPPGQTRRVGSPHPKDYPVLSRVIAVETVLYMEDYDMYIQTFGGAANPVVDTGWSCTPVAGDFDMTLLSPAVIGTTTDYHQLRILTQGGNMRWLARPIRIRPNQPVMLALTGTVIPASSAYRDIYVYMQNGQAADYHP